MVLDAAKFTIKFPGENMLLTYPTFSLCPYLVEKESSGLSFSSLEDPDTIMRFPLLQSHPILITPKGLTSKYYHTGEQGFNI